MKEANEVKELYESIIKLVEQTRNRVYKTINTEMVELYWNIGKRIVEKQEGRSRARYGESLLIDISKKLTNYFGKGFSEKNLERMRSFYICFPISTTLSSELSWSHYLILIKIKDNNTIFSSEYRLAIPTDKEFIDIIEHEKTNIELT